MVYLFLVLGKIEIDMDNYYVFINSKHYSCYVQPHGKLKKFLWMYYHKQIDFDVKYFQQSKLEQETPLKRLTTYQWSTIKMYS